MLFGDTLSNLLVALASGLLFTIIPLVITNRKNKQQDKQKAADKNRADQDLRDQEEYQSLLNKAHAIDGRLDSYIQRIEAENNRLRTENTVLDDKLDEMRNLLLDCKDKLRTAQALLAHFQKKESKNEY